ncbi:roadblock/LC7 domain-containing protein [Streptomyces sp. NPDC002671]
MEAKAPEIDWLLNDFVAHTTGARAALLTSTDGLTIAHHNLADDNDATASRLSAITSGVHSLTKGAAELLNGATGVNQILMDVEGGQLYIMAAGSGALLTVLATNEADPGMIGFEASMLITRFPQNLTVAPRVPAAGAGWPEQ